LPWLILSFSPSPQNDVGRARRALVTGARPIWIDCFAAHVSHCRAKALVLCLWKRFLKTILFLSQGASIPVFKRTD
jgi:hypothetical protein